MSTTDTIPGVDRPVAQSAMFWSSGHKTMSDAGEWLRQCALKNGYDAVVGISFTPHPGASYGHTPSRPRLHWAVAGTAIRWRD